MTYLPCEHTPIESQVTRNVNELNVRGHLLAHNQVDDVSGDERSSRQACLHTVSEDNYVSGEHTLDRIHDTRGRKVLPRVEGSLKENDDKKYDSEGKVGCLWVRVPQRLPAGSKSQVRYKPVEIPLRKKGGQSMSYQAMKQTTLAASSKLPNPPKTQPTTLRSTRFGGGEIWLAPYCAARRCACATSRPVFGATANRRSASSMDTRCQLSSDKSREKDRMVLMLFSDRRAGLDRPLTAFLDAPPLLPWSDLLVCSKCKLIVRYSMGRRAEGGTVGACIESVLRVMRIRSPSRSRCLVSVGTIVIRWFSTSFDMAKSGEQEKGFGDPPWKKKNAEAAEVFTALFNE